MKSRFSPTWNASVQPRKQVKFRMNAAIHIKRTFMGAHLEKSLRERFKRRSLCLRKGDEVVIMRGSFVKKRGKVGTVDIKRTRIQVEGVQRQKRGGEKLTTWFHPSNVMITSLDEKDSRRFKHTKQQKESLKKHDAEELKMKDIPVETPTEVKKKRIKKPTTKPTEKIRKPRQKKAGGENHAP